MLLKPKTKKNTIITIIQSLQKIFFYTEAITYL